MVWLIITLVVCVGLVLFKTWAEAKMDTPEFTGKIAEKMIQLDLKRFNPNGVALNNVYIPKDNGETTEIDIIYITIKGIFVIESKNYSGWIFGDERQQYWTASLPNGPKNKFYNPIKQNQGHIKYLREYLGKEYPCYSFVVFSNRCELKKVTVLSDNIKVIKRDRLDDEVLSVWNSTADILTADEMAAISEKLRPLTKITIEQKQEHIDNINEKYNKLTEPVLQTDNDLICPKCGAPLVLRTAKRGENAGKQFYGCSGYPKCRFIKNI